MGSWLSKSAALSDSREPYLMPLFDVCETQMEAYIFGNHGMVCRVSASLGKVESSVLACVRFQAQVPLLANA